MIWKLINHSNDGKYLTKSYIMIVIISYEYHRSVKSKNNYKRPIYKNLIIILYYYHETFPLFMTNDLYK